MDNDYYVDVVTKNILSALAEHISDAISDQLIGVVKKTTAQLETKLFTMFDSVSKDIVNSISDNLLVFKDHLLANDSAINSIEAGLVEIKQKLSSVNTDQIDALAKSVEGGLTSIVSEIKASLGENNKEQINSLKAAMDAMAANIKQIDASVISLANKDHSEILRMMLEGELRNTEAMAVRALDTKKEIEERLNRLNGFS
ncbi:hypothetical protein [Candidatus Magnetominusculus xianensis]|uniref:Uncharacterized protein n=1 Tax=Candidatus Magnetominusculus xianensis TaxID=1748249 RepID=A0ABR5SBH1_9BACT|nr:hypothetical protein [Candidatus Magnetominusculus xianensis]KWT77381.1 hypothetical protein ASN18_3024 [Candidatus Magnetominusculus xianensis]MBF0405187.1 hypothetical protein [Nitrospirota bacterium]